MKLNISKTIENNIIGVNITVDSLGTANITSEEEAAILNDFPRSIKFSEINFKANIKLNDDNDPVVTDDVVDDSTVVAVELKNIINKEYLINKDMNISMSFDVTKIPTAEVNAVLTTVEEVGKAYAVVFADKIQKEISKKLLEVRSLNTKFEGEEEVVL